MTGEDRIPHGGDESRELVAFLRSQRWFGEKARDIRSAAVLDTVPVQWAGSAARFAVARVRVETEDGPADYQLFLREDGDRYADALEDDGFRRGLVHAFATGASFQGGDARWAVESESAASFKVPADAPITLSAAEQSNSSLVIGTQAILKLFRKLTPGVHPDLEVTRFLTIERRFLHTPALLGSIHFADARGVAAAGMLQELVPGAMDGWRYALECSGAYFRSGTADDPMPFEREAEELGAVTRAMHEAMASGDPGGAFEWHAATAADVRAWTRAAAEMIDRASRSLDRAAAEQRLPSQRVDEARTIAEKRLGYVEWMSELAGEIGSDAGGCTRVHGDYHLGQVLRSATNQFLVIDFEGEPARPLEERRRRNSPLRDVAGMLRSFSYAAAAGGQLARESSGPRRSPHEAHIRASRWERSAREAFLRGYFGAPPARHDLLPHSRNNAARLIALFEAEKVFYELQYELDHRPDWVWIPLRGIGKLYS